MAYLCPSALGIILQIALPRSQKGALLFGNYLIGSYVASLVIGFSLPTVNSAGYTKRLTLTGTVFLGYCVGNSASLSLFVLFFFPLVLIGSRLPSPSQSSVLRPSSPEKFLSTRLDSVSLHLLRIRSTMNPFPDQHPHSPFSLPLRRLPRHALRPVSPPRYPPSLLRPREQEEGSTHG